MCRWWCVTRRLARLRRNPAAFLGVCLLCGALLLLWLFSSSVDVASEPPLSEMLMLQNRDYASLTITTPPPPSPSGVKEKIRAAVSSHTSIHLKKPQSGSEKRRNGSLVETVSVPAELLRYTDGLQASYASELEGLEEHDMPPRDGERRISFVEFAGCLGRLLDVHPGRAQEQPRVSASAKTYAPFLISVTMENAQDLKALICNLTVPYRYIALIQNGDTPEVTPLFTLLERVFAFTARLTILRFPGNIGYAGAVNAGLREALGHPYREVPFVHIVHNDVRLLFDSFQSVVNDAYAETEGDDAVIAALEARVKAEPNNNTPLVFQPRGLRSPLTLRDPLPQQRSSEVASLVTSALLPDYVRYSDAADRRVSFAGRVSFMFHNNRREYTSVFLSRLAVLTVGFFDENFYPILFEDTDFRWRASLLGFYESAPSYDIFLAYDRDCITMELNARGEQKSEKKGPSLSPEGVALQQDCRKAFFQSLQYGYMRLKWRIGSLTELSDPTTVREPFGGEVFGGKRRLPLDAWVVDVQRLRRVKRWLRDVGRGALDIPAYDPDVILQAVS